MRVLLVQCHLGRKATHAPLFPLGLCYIATALKEHEVTIFDMNLWEIADSLYRLKQKILDFEPEILGLSLRNVDTTQRHDLFAYYKTLGPTTQLIKLTAPRMPIVIGGTGFAGPGKVTRE